jgi:exopolysaccharide biosynthesis polyprenyl glycosylphosphotransferase
MCGDLAVCGVSLLLASALLYRPLWDTDALLLRHPLWQLLTTLALGFCWHLSLVATGAYKSYRIASWGNQAAALARGTTLSSVCTCVWLCRRWSTKIARHSLLLELLLFWALTLSGLLLTRIGARLLTRFLRRRGRNLRNVLIVGSNRRAIALADDLLGDSGFGYRLTGFVDDFWYFDGAPERYKQKLIGHSDTILELLRNLALDEVIIALPIASYYQLTQQIIDLCRQQGILVRCEGSLFDIQRSVQSIASLPQKLITLHDCTRDEWSVAGKRVVDLVVSTLVLTTMLPLLVGIVLAIKLTSPGPAVFSQERLGMGKRRFRIFKFRTMVLDAESLMDKVEHLNQSKGPTFKLQHDPRITPVGVILRRTSLDELPQLFNVFFGDMSLVGPRPLPMRDYHGFSEDWHRRRFSVKPGITCLWQVNGRSSVGFERWMELDMDYIDRWSLWLDFMILIQTIPAVLRGSGAM